MAHSATLNGNCDPKGVVATVSFQWGTDTTYGNVVEAGEVTTPGAFSATITDLLGSTEYHFRAVAINVSGTSFGEDMTFTTLPDAPTVETLPATNVS